MPRSLLLCGLLLVGLLIPAAHAQSDEIRVVAQIQQARIFAGLPVTLDVEVLGSTEVRPVAMVPPRGIIIEFAGMTRMPSPITIINGTPIDSGSDRVRIRYLVTANQPGEHEIPAISVNVDGRIYRSQPVRFTALEPEEIQSARVVLTVDHDAPFVGEPFRMTLTWYVGLRTNPIGVTGVLDTQQFELFTPLDDSWLRDARGSIDIRFLGDRAAWALERQVEHEGKLWTAVSIQRLVIAHEPGTLEFGPFTVIFDDLGTLNTPGRRHIIRSNTISLSISPVPKQGRPAGFDGLVGRCDLTARTEQTQVGVGDPITLRVRVDAGEPVGRITPPPLGPGSALRDGFKVSQEGWRLVDQSAAGRVYQTTIRARSDRITQIPPIELPYFDAQRGAFRVARSEPIRIAVSSRGEITAEDAVIAPRESVQAERAALGPEQLGLPANYPASDALRRTTLDIERFLTGSTGVTLMLAPPGLWVGAWGVVAIGRRRRDPVRRRRGAFQRARRRLGRGSSPTMIADAIRGYLAERFAGEAQAMTDADCRVLLANTEHGQALSLLLARCDDPRYCGPNPADAPGPGCDAGEVLALLRTIERELRSLS